MKTDSLRAEVTALVAAACKHKLMNGWMGDRSTEFQRGQVAMILAADEHERRRWMDMMAANVAHRERMLAIPN